MLIYANKDLRVDVRACSFTVAFDIEADKTIAKPSGLKHPEKRTMRQLRLGVDSELHPLSVRSKVDESGSIDGPCDKYCRNPSRKGYTSERAGFF